MRPAKFLLLPVLITPLSARAAPPQLKVGTGTWTDTACFGVEYECLEPTSVSIEFAGNSLVEWRQPGPGEHGTPLPRSICVDVDGLGDGTKPLSVYEDCEGNIESAGASVLVDDIGFELVGVSLAGPEVHAGSTVTIMLEATNPGLSVDIDFSAIDPYYVPGSELVIDNLDGTYEIAYQLPNYGTAATGIYALPVTLSDPAVGASRTWANVVRMPYSEQRTPIFQVTGDSVGRVLYVDPPARAPLIYEAKVVENSLSLSDSTLSRGEVTTLTGQFDVFGDRLPRGIATLYIAEDNADGVIEVTVPGLNESCTTGSSGAVCRYDFSVDLMLRPGADLLTGAGTGPYPSFSSQLSVGVRASVRDAFLDDAPPLDWIPFTGGPNMDDAPPSTSTHYVARGHVTYVNHTIEARQDPLQPHEDEPQYDGISRSTESWNLADTRVQVRDGCGGIHNGLTDSLGNYELIFSSLCPHLVASIWVVSESTRGFLRTKVYDTNDDLYDVNIANFTPQQAWIHELGPASLANANSAPFRILQLLMLGQTWTKHNLLGESWVFAMPWAEGRWERDWCPDPDLSTSQFDPQSEVIEICSADGVGETFVNRDEWDPFIIMHEYFHWVQHQFMRGGTGSAYSDRRRDATEGYATVMPALVWGSEWRTERLAGGDANDLYGANAFTAENLDFNGNTGTSVRWLPLDLWGPNPPCSEQSVGTCSTAASTTGGWAWRTLWDFADPDDLTMEEPYTSYVRGPQGVAPVNLVSFDEIGDLETWVDLLNGYLGDGYLPTNPALQDLDRGLPGMEIVEYIDGIVCRDNGVTLGDIQVVVEDVMDFRQYDPNSAPLACP